MEQIYVVMRELEDGYVELVAAFVTQELAMEEMLSLMKDNPNEEQEYYIEPVYLNKGE